MRYFLVLGFALSFLGCGKGFQDSQPSEPQNISVSELKNYVSVQVENGPEPEKYVVHFSWPKLEPARQIRIRSEKPLGVLNPEQRIFSHTVNHNQVVNYVFEVLAPSGVVEDKFSKSVVIPRDFVVKEKNRVVLENGNLKYNRLFLSDVPLQTFGKKVTIEVNELHSQNGVIEAFPETATAPDEQDGRSAGELVIKAKIAKGDLKIFMRGERGGKGKKGPPMERAARGTPGTEGSYDCTGGPSSGALDKPEWARKICMCLPRGENGGPGADGVKGNKGLQGKTGGDSGYARINIQDGSELNLQTFSIPGAPGEGGPGGDGQLGGLGGPSQGQKCHGDVGPEGNTGPQGDQGPDGLSGKKGTLCVYVASTQENRCEE